MAKRPNYGFVKHQKELKRQQRKKEKAERKRVKQDGSAADNPETTDADSETNIPE